MRSYEEIHSQPDYCAGIALWNGDGQQKDDGAAIPHFMRGAAKGDAPCQHILGLAYNEGRGVEKDEHRALNYFEAASATGYPLSAEILGNAYMEGRGVTQNEETAIRYYQIAAKWPGFETVQYRLGLAYLAGRGVTRNFATGEKYLRAAAQGYDPKIKTKAIDLLQAIATVPEAGILGVLGLRRRPDRSGLLHLMVKSQQPHGGDHDEGTI